MFKRLFSKLKVSSKPATPTSTALDPDSTTEPYHTFEVVNNRQPAQHELGGEEEEEEEKEEEEEEKEEAEEEHNVPPRLQPHGFSNKCTLPPVPGRKHANKISSEQTSIHNEVEKVESPSSLDKNTHIFVEFSNNVKQHNKSEENIYDLVEAPTNPPQKESKNEIKPKIIPPNAGFRPMIAELEQRLHIEKFKNQAGEKNNHSQTNPPEIHDIDSRGAILKPKMSKPLPNISQNDVNTTTGPKLPPKTLRPLSKIHDHSRADPPEIHEIDSRGAILKPKMLKPLPNISENEVNTTAGPTLPPKTLRPLSKILQGEESTAQANLSQGPKPQSKILNPLPIITQNHEPKQYPTINKRPQIFPKQLTARPKSEIHVRPHSKSQTVAANFHSDITPQEETRLDPAKNSKEIKPAVKKRQENRIRDVCVRPKSEIDKSLCFEAFDNPIYYSVEKYTLQENVPIVPPKLPPRPPNQGNPRPTFENVTRALIEEQDSPIEQMLKEAYKLHQGLRNSEDNTSTNSNTFKDANAEEIYSLPVDYQCSTSTSARDLNAPKNIPSVSPIYMTPVTDEEENEQDKFVYSISSKDLEE